MLYLQCDLELNCHSLFDEHLAAARLQRPTSASEPLGRGEEWRVQLAGNSYVRFETASEQIDLALEGEAGYSLCTEGNGVACPFYLSSLELSAIQTDTLEDTCPDQSEFSVAVTDFDVEIVQPAFGVADDGTDEKAFPKHSVHIRAFLTVNGNSYPIRAANQHPIYFEADTTGLFTGDMEVDLQLPCGAGTIDVTAAVRLQSTAILEHPPEIAITTASPIACDGSPVALTANVDDEDEDLASVRWYIDDVLMGPSVTSVAMTEGHVLRAVAFDARGAASTDEVSLECE